MRNNSEDSDYVYVFNGNSTLLNRNNNNNSTTAQPPPSYDEAIAISVNPSSVTITPAARSVTIEPPSHEQISIEPLETTDNIQKSNIEGVPLLSQVDMNSYNNGSSSNNPPPEYTISDAEFETSDQGVTSLDSKINNEVESLYRFFIAHNDRPRMAVKIHGISIKKIYLMFFSLN